MKKSVLSIFACLIFISGFAQQKNIADKSLEGLAIRWQPEINPSVFIEKFNALHSGISLFIKREVVKEWNFYQIGIESKTSDLQTVKTILESYPEVIRAYPPQKVEFRKAPNDPRYPDQWELSTIDIQKVWDVTTGGLTVQGDTIVVAILDSGFDIDHEDFDGNIWRNHGEIPNDSIDNDNNGLVDDLTGWNFVGNKNYYEKSGHGTAVAGVVGARTDNGLGIAGVNWQIKMVLYQIHNSLDVVAAYHQVLKLRRKYNRTDGREGAFVVATNASFGIDSKTCSDEPEWLQIYDSLGMEGVLSVVATQNAPVNIETAGDLPSDCPSDFMIAVTNTNRADQLSPSAAYGAVSVDLAAPGDGTMSLWTSNSYHEDFQGTSSSSPRVAGAIALLYSLPCVKLIQSARENPATTALIMKSFILNGVDILPSLQEKTLTGGRLNVNNSTQLILEYCMETVSGLSIKKVFPNPAENTLIIQYISPDFGAFQIEVFDLLGRKVYAGVSQAGIIGERQHTINVTPWVSGQYILRIFNNEFTATTKFQVF